MGNRSLSVSLSQKQLLNVILIIGNSVYFKSWCAKTTGFVKEEEADQKYIRGERKKHTKH